MQKSEAREILRRATDNPLATFRHQQWEAIEGLVNQQKRLLLVQRTGWGKSLVYFLATRILRDRGRGLAIIVSPLLALMRNQMEAARRIGVHAVSINSSLSRDETERLVEQLHANRVDCLLVSPEKLANEKFVQETLGPVLEHVGMLVVDEAHCISDWGHDFRPDYRRLVNILQRLPDNLPVLGTTATANDRVIEDIRQQLGDITVLRGPLERESLALQNIALPDQGSRLAWLAQTIPNLPGTGVVYVLTKRDALQVRDWLKFRNIKAEAYFSGIEHPDFADGNAYRQHLEGDLLKNRIKVLVATTALGMGYDKPDLAFVIHYQATGSIIGYYQQVGRAGRAIDKAYGFLLSGSEDADIHAYFRNSAFPSADEVEQILDMLEASDGMSSRDLEARLNLRHGRIAQALNFLAVENPPPVYKQGSQWVRTATSYTLDRAHINRLTGMREEEWQEVQAYIHHQGCLMQFLQRALDDPAHQPCGRCASCLARPLVTNRANDDLIQKAYRFMRHSEFPLEAKKQFAAGAFEVYDFRGNIKNELKAEEGRVLSRWNDMAWGKKVADDKHKGHFRDELVDAMAQMISQRWRPQLAPQWVTCVPSTRRPDLVPDFAQRLAGLLGLPFMPVLVKTRENQQQKLQENRYHQCRNLDGAFGVEASVPDAPVLLVDDVVDSGWTMTVLAALLRQHGSGPVFPVALASSSAGGN